MNMATETDTTITPPAIVAPEEAIETPEYLVEALSLALDGKLKPSGGCIAKCPAHEDSNPSLSISIGDNGKLLFHCFSGCSQDAVVEALKERGLWPGSQGKVTVSDDSARRADQQNKERQRKYDKAAETAKNVWEKSYPARPDHPYLLRKQVQPPTSLKEVGLSRLMRFIGYHPQANDEPLSLGRILVIPIEIDGLVSSLEFIDQNGRKSAMAGGKKSSGYWATGKFPEGDGEGLQILVGEGVATVLSPAAALDCLGIAALSSGNLQTVAKQVRARFPKAEITILADLVKKTGLPDPNATKAAKEISGKLAIPDFGPERSEKMTDFNDLAVEKGIDAVKECVEKAAIPDFGAAATPIKPPLKSDGTADAERVLERCAFMRHCRDDAATLPEGQWFAMVSNLARCADGMEVVHRLSEPYPGYNQAETEEKARHAIQDSGPITCAHIKNTTRGKYCGECQETCKSPIVLGRTRNEVAEAIEEMNQEHAVVWLGGKLRILWKNLTDKTFDFVSVYDFKQFYANKKYDVNGNQIDIGNIWMTSKDRKDYKGGVVFYPSGSCENCLNLYKGFTCEPRQGDWSLMRQHVLEIICGGNVEYFAYLMAWTARMFQDPGGTRPGVAVVMRGGKGAGKGIFINALGDILGEHFLPVANVGQITGRFNSHLAQSILLFADEAFFAGDKRQEGPLKALITEDHITFEKKGVDSVKMRCHINIIMASNEDWVVPASGDERRFFVIDVEKDRVDDHPYFQAIIDQMDNGGREAMLYDLMHHDHKSVNLRKPPETDALIDQKSHSLPDAAEFWVEALVRGYIISEQKPDSTVNYEAEWEGSESMFFPLYKAQIYDEFKFWCNSSRKRYILGLVQFCKFSFGRDGLFKRGKSFTEEHPRHGRGIKFNTLEVCRADVIKKYGDVFKQAGGCGDSEPFEKF